MVRLPNEKFLSRDTGRTGGSCQNGWMLGYRRILSHYAANLRLSLAAFGLFYAVAYWNTYFSGVLYINSDSLRPLQVLLQMLLISASQMADPSMAAMLESERTVPPQVIKMAAVVISSLPIVMVYPFLQKYFVKGMMVGSVKG